jgi:hypothetical protein
MYSVGGISLCREGVKFIEDRARPHAHGLDRKWRDLFDATRKEIDRIAITQSGMRLRSLQPTGGQRGSVETQQRLIVEHLAGAELDALDGWRPRWKQRLLSTKRSYGLANKTAANCPVSTTRRGRRPRRAFQTR